MTDISLKIAATGLPLVPHLGTIVSALRERGAAVVRSDPGSGKSTLIPLALLSAAEASGEAGRILMLEPRRVAAVGIAGRMSDLLDENVGGRVGYSVRMDRAVSSRTRIEVLTEGLLVRRIQGDPDLSGVRTVIFDEFHERSVHADLALALLLDLRRIREDLRILILSATLDARRVADFLDAAEGRSGDSSCAVVDCPGRAYPVNVEYRPVDERSRIGDSAAAAVSDFLTQGNGGGDGSTLVFLPGRREIADAAARLASLTASDRFEILTLHGGLSLPEQKRVLGAGRGDRRRIILTTNVAETGLTVPGVTAVVDSGYVRLERFHLPTGMDRLSLEAASLHSADQRAGRAGRLGPGVCLRLWRADAPRPRETEPELLRVDLSPVVLECALWGALSREGLRWLDEPPRAAWDGAAELLRELGALDGAGKVTPRGRRMASLGLSPRHAALVLAGEAADRAAAACAAAAILSDRDGSLIRDDADLRRRMAVLRGDRSEGGQNGPWRERTLDTAADLMTRLGRRTEPLRWTVAQESDVGVLVAAAFPDRVAQRRGDDRFRFPSGREARIAGPLAAETWLTAPEVDAGERTGTIRLAAPLSAEEAEAVLAPLTSEERTVEWNGLIPRTVVRRRADRLMLSELRAKCSRTEAAADLPRLLASEGLSLLPWDDSGGAPRRFLERLRFAAERSGGDGPAAAEDWVDTALAADAETWLGPYLWNGAETGSGPILDGQSLLQALRGRLGWSAAEELDRCVPGELKTPAGTMRRLDYSSGEPVLRLRIQEVFGLSEGPRILDSRVVFQLLSPADRPLQTTRDLAGFWTGSYAEVRKEMRGRYPKHYWPEDPRIAEPRRGAGKPKES